MELDSTDALPLYKQLKNIIKTDISKGKYKKGERIPPELELSRVYGVSRITVRNALEELTQENILVRQQGKGTFVSSDKFSRQIFGERSFTEMCRSDGYEPGARTIKSIIEDATAEDVAELGVDPKSKIIVIERIRYANGIAVSLEVSRMPERFSFLLDEDLNNSSMFEILRKKYNTIFKDSHKTLELIFASYEMARYLGISAGYPLLLIKCVSKDQNGQPAHRSTQYIVGDKFKIII